MQAAVATADVIGRVLRRVLRRRAPLRTTGTGVSVVVLGGRDRAADDATIASVEVALARISEPSEIVVAAADSERELRRALRRSRREWVYLLEAGAAVDTDAISQVCGWRRDYVFAVASREIPGDSGWTGWSAMRAEHGQLRLEDDEPPDETNVRGGAFGSSRSTLFHRRTLRRLLAPRGCYRSRTTALAEAGVRAWREGYVVLFCPLSIVRRAGVAGAARGELPARDAALFALRNPSDEDGYGRLEDIRAGWSPRVTTPRKLCLVMAGRIRFALARCPSAPPPLLHRKLYPPPAAARDGAPRVVLVTPYAIYPPAHGGAVRLKGLIEEIARHYRIVLVSDEQDAYGPVSLRYFDGLEAVHLIGGRPDDRGRVSGRIARIETHSHAALREEVAHVVACYRPALVHVEYLELAGLVAVRTPGVPWVLTLHDVLFANVDSDGEADRYERRLIEQFDAVVACSKEDAALLRHPHLLVVAHGARIDDGFTASCGRTDILFAGPFRYAPNFDGVRVFLTEVYPTLKRTFPWLGMTILGGSGAAERARGEACFAQDGVEVVDLVEDTRPWLDRAAVTINPQYGVRGASVKLIESLAAGRVCVSTRDGARGYLDRRFKGLIVVDRIEDFAVPLRRLLGDEDARARLEVPERERLAPFSWRTCAAEQIELYRDCIARARRAR